MPRIHMHVVIVRTCIYIRWLASSTGTQLVMWLIRKICHWVMYGAWILSWYDTTDRVS